ncbi:MULTISPECIES: threonine synthase [Desulfococcus]|uniref:Threonine synthase n=1 Tax=Desulfococcus multivorans DSM 2059 TaxID=1121405 RepID=S7TNY8_DESML|nr:threonine synthase [Desulfococcus multivorans]AOY57850.1 ThrC: threonine synthase [Desulfococcus multivorans]AQV00229.1 threonine synthase [Desulfococcus multivorans]EPR38932.1 threonine synthase [Desulfococcus multivorans DSM 2059]SJZ67062.1 L-threonine synthase [Desulfococcus multivorans DSM 2059]
MKPQDFPKEIRSYLIPEKAGRLAYHCLGCGTVHGIDKLLYTCPDCGQVLLIQDEQFDRLRQIPGPLWRRIFDYRRMLKIPALKGIYLYHEFIGSVIPLSDIVYLGEGHTPIVSANNTLQELAGMAFFFKNDGQNPSASFKDRGMASAFSYINYLIKSGKIKNVLAVCASTGDTSAAAALYAAYLKPHVKSAVLLPHKKVTPQQLSQPLGSGARVFEIPGVFDDCMKVVEHLAEHYPVALLNSKNAWRILGQESYSYEIAQDFEYDMAGKVIVVPIGNAGNITAVMSGFLKFYDIGIIDVLPKIIGVQSAHANPVYRYYMEPDPAKRRFVPMAVKPSVAQAAMIGNPVSMPRVIHLAEKYNQIAGEQRVFFVEVTEQEIMDWELTANHNGHIACTHGGESLAGLVRARQTGLVDTDETAVVDSTAHALKFAGFQEMYFENRFPDEFGIHPDPRLMNRPVYMRPDDLEKVPAPGNPIDGEDFEKFVRRVSEEIARTLDLVAL